MDSSPIYPRRFPVFCFLGLALSIAALFWFFRVWQQRAPVVQRCDLFSYLRTTLPPVPFWKTYTVVMDGRSLADASSTGLMLSSRSIEADPEKLRTFLRDNVYDGDPFWMVLGWPLGGFIACLILLMGLGDRMDRARRKKTRDGQVLRGPQLVSKWRWNWSIARRNWGFYVEVDQ